jgi:acyl-CoA thioesterase-1
MRLFLLLGCLIFSAAVNAAPVILVFGDSLSAAYGIPQQAGWVSLLPQRLEQERFHYSVVNASISGETTSGGRERIGKALAQHRPAIVILELGANDGLRGLSPEAARANLAAMLQACRKQKARILLIGMKMPPNYGAVYTRQFEETYRELARQFGTGLVPFLFEGFGEKREWFQADGLHPTVAAQPAVLENVWQELKPLLNK